MSAVPAAGAKIRSLRPSTPIRAAGLAPAGWSTAFDERTYRAEAMQGNADLIPKPLSVRLRLLRGEHIERLLREIELVAPFFDRDRDVVALHVDAGDAAAPAARDLELLTQSLDRHFHLTRGTRRGYSLRMPADAPGCGDLGACLALGFESVTLVAGHSDEDVARAVRMARAEGVRSIAVEATLPDHHLPEGLLASLPERLTLSLPRIAPAGPGPGHLEQIGQMAARLAEGGYVGIGLDPRPLAEFDPGRPAELTAVVRGSPPPSPDIEVDLLGLGPGMSSRVHDALCENHADEESWAGALDAGVLPLARGIVLDADGRLRMEVIRQLLRHGCVAADSIARRHDVDFHRYFEGELARLVEAFGGLVRLSPWCLETTSQGRLLLRIIAACFDTPRANPTR